MNPPDGLEARIRRQCDGAAQAQAGEGAVWQAQAAKGERRGERPCCEAPQLRVQRAGDGEAVMVVLPTHIKTVMFHWPVLFTVMLCFQPRGTLFPSFACSDTLRVYACYCVVFKIWCLDKGSGLYRKKRVFPWYLVYQYKSTVSFGTDVSRPVLWGPFWAPQFLYLGFLKLEALMILCFPVGSGN